MFLHQKRKNIKGIKIDAISYAKYIYIITCYIFHEKIVLPDIYFDKNRFFYKKQKYQTKNIRPCPKTITQIS